MRRLISILVFLACPVALAQYGSTAASMIRPTVTFAQLSAISNPQPMYARNCSDCTQTVPCAGGGTGALALYINGGWSCTAGAVGAGGGGTVTSVGNGTIGSLFTASWANSTTTPALSLDITNQGTTTTVLHGNAAGHPSFGSVVNADLSLTATTCTSQFLRAFSATAGVTCSSIATGDLPSTAVTPGSYTNTNLTVDATGRITAASNGSGGVTNSAGNNFVTKSNGTNLVASSITDDGAKVTTTLPVIVPGSGAAFCYNGQAVTDVCYRKSTAFNGSPRVQLLTGDLSSWATLDLSILAFSGGASLTSASGSLLTFQSGTSMNQAATIAAATTCLWTSGQSSSDTCMKRDGSGTTARFQFGSSTAGNVGGELNAASYTGGPANSGTNQSGQTVTIASQPSTGNAGSGDVVTKVAPQGASGSSANTLADRDRIIAKSTTLTSGSATDVFKVSIASGSAAGGTGKFSVYATDGTDHQLDRIAFEWSAVNKAGTVTCALTTPAEAKTVSAGTLTLTGVTCADTTANEVKFSINASSSLTTTKFTATGRVMQDGGNGLITGF